MLVVRRSDELRALKREAIAHILPHSNRTRVFIDVENQRAIFELKGGEELAPESEMRSLRSRPACVKPADYTAATLYTAPAT